MIDKGCNICGSKDHRGYLRFKDKDREVVVCKGCGTFRSFPYSEMDYKEQEFYCEHYIKNEKLFRGFAGNMIDIVTRHKQKGRLLDIGCAVGFVLEEARESGFEAEGVELNKKAADIARSKGFDVQCRDLNNTDYAGNSFDVIILNHVLEHIFKPNIFLEKIKRILKEDGILIAGVPNHGSLIAGLCGTRWYGWGIPEHIWHFDKKSLTGLLARNGFMMKELIRNSQYYAFSRSFRKNARAVIAGIGNIIGAGDQLIAVAGVKL